jgi:hypothetical protein
MNTHNYLSVLLLSVVVTFFSFSAGRAMESDKQSSASLTGIKAVGLVVEDLAPDAEQEGFTTHLIQADAEQKLRAAGIRVLTDEALTKTPGMPYLYVNIFTFRDAELYAYHITLELKQMVSLVRNSRVKQSAGTWKVSGGGTVGAKKLTDLRAFVLDDVARFISAYKSVNP